MVREACSIQLSVSNERRKRQVDGVFLFGHQGRDEVLGGPDHRLSECWTLEDDVHSDVAELLQLAARVPERDSRDGI